jgi:hypothetical protein
MDRTKDPLLGIITDLLHRENIPVILWGELAMKLYGIPTVISVSVSQVFTIVSTELFSCRTAH